jgi:hypothetical protein
MNLGSRLIAVAGFLLLSGCEPVTHNASHRAVVELSLSGDELVCHVESIATRLGLRAGSVRSEQARGTMIAFRLVGRDMEISALNPHGGREFDLSGYHMSAARDADERLTATFAAFREALVRPPPPECIQ